MRVAILGAGAMGSVFGGRLAAAGNDVWLIDIWREHVEMINREGLSIEGQPSPATVAVQATTDPAKAREPELVVVFVKSTETRAAVQAARDALGGAPIYLTLQNGLGNHDIIASLVGAERVVSGVTYISAQLLGPARVQQSNAATTHIGELRGDGAVTPRVERLVALLNEAGLPAQATANLLQEVWAKLVVNACANAACALAGCTARDLGLYPSALELVGLVAEETAAVARALGAGPPPGEAARKMQDLVRKAGPVKPSMLQDVEKGNWTEVDFINGAVVRAGEGAGVATPYNHALTLLVRLLEARQHGAERPPLEL
jgi:2-dehydropantoate 2-reductase